jgi:UDPglucose--hexose-1-phosphate uridylyltransferase
MPETPSPVIPPSAGTAALRPHRRFNPLRGQWVLVSPQRTQRPWQGQTTKPAAPEKIAYDPTCYLCPGNPRAGGAQTPPYDGVYVFDNDYPALLPPDSAAPPPPSAGLLIAQPESGRCRVVCFDPNHSLTLAGMSPEGIARVIETWRQETRDLGADPQTAYVQVFENRGAMMGSSNPHPHGQIWATGHIPDEPAAETLNQRAYLAQHQRLLLSDYRDQELAARAAGQNAERAAGQAAGPSAESHRIVLENSEFLAVVPFWAVWPFETLILAKRSIPSFLEFDSAQVAGLADLLKRLTSTYDALFSVSFPYTMGFHQRPTDGAPYPEWEWHGHFYPPLLRSAEIRKFMVGFEMLGMPQRDITPEIAAQMLRAASPKETA